MLFDKKMDRKTLKYYARMASEAYINDPVYVWACKNENIRKRFIYHFILLRLNSSRKKDIFYLDEENRGICIFREAHYDYTMWQFLMCPNWVFLVLYFPVTIKTLMAYSHLDNKDVFDENTYIVSPVFVAKEHQGKGIASRLLKEGIEELTARGCRIGLETQNPDNVKFYERLGFSVAKKEYYKTEKIFNFYMITGE